MHLLGQLLMSRNTLKLDAQINIVPYLDIFLVLTVIFMASVAPLYHQAEVDLPQIKSAGEITLDQGMLPLIVSLDKEGHYHLRNQYLNEHHLTRQELLCKLQALYLKQQDQKIVLEADKHVVYDQVMQLMHIIHNAGFTRVGY